MPLDPGMLGEQANGGGGAPGENPTMTPVDHDPFQDPESVQAMLHAIMQTEQRMLQIEMVLGQGIMDLRATLQDMINHMEGLHGSHESLRRAISAPRKILRDKDGRPSGVTIDNDTQEIVG